MLKSKMLRICALVLVAALCLGLVACNPEDETTAAATKFTVAFNVEGKIWRTEEVTKNTRITQPENPTFSGEGKVFTAWYTDSEFKNEWNFKTGIVREDMTLYAGYYEVTAYPSSAGKANEPITSKLQWVQSALSPEGSYKVTLTNARTGSVIELAGKAAFDAANNLVTYTPAAAIPAGFYNVVIVDTKTMAEGEKIELTEVVLGGEGTEANPYPIASELDFTAVSQKNVEAGTYFALYQDITIHPFRNDQKDFTFNGQLLGRGLTITLEEANCGAIYKLGPQGKIYNLNVAGSVTTQVDSVGALVDYNEGTIEKVTSIAGVESTAGLVGTINIDKTLDKNAAEGRGIAGCIVGTNCESGKILNCKVSSDATDKGVVKANIAGGLFAGYNCGLISGCSTNGIVGAANTKLIAKSTSRYSYAGAITGINEGTVTKCLVEVGTRILAQRYANAELAAAAPGTNNSNIGGIAGWNREKGVISECMFSGTRVHGDENVGGIAGCNDGAISSCGVEGELHESRKIVTYVGGRINVGGIAGAGKGSVDNCFVTANVFGFTAGSVYKIAASANNSVYLPANPNAGTNSVADDYSGAAGYVEADQMVVPADPAGNGNVAVSEAIDGSATISLAESYLSKLGDKFYFNKTVRLTCEKDRAPEQTIKVEIYKDGYLWGTIDLGETPATIDGPYSRGETLAGWTTKAGSTEIQYAADRAISLYNLQDYMQDGVVKIYPLYTETPAQTSLKIAVWSRYISDDLLAAIKAEFESKKSGDYQIEWVTFESAEKSDPYYAVADFGKAVMEAGDFDIIIGAGANINTTGGVTSLQKEKNDANNATLADVADRYSVLMTDGKYSMEFYAYMTGQESQEANVTLNGDEGSSTVNSLNNLLGNEAAMPIITVPEGQVLAGWATTKDAAKAEITKKSGLAYEDVKDLLVDGSVILYPVFETPYNPVITDSAVKIAVWTKDGDWVTDDELAKIDAEFKAFLESHGIDSSKLTITYEKITSDGNKVADLGALTNAGSYDLIIGCGANVTSKGGVEVLKKADIPAGLVAAGRMIAAITENTIAEVLYHWATNY